MKNRGCDVYVVHYLIIPSTHCYIVISELCMKKNSMTILYCRVT